jgi:hypothetical protein
MVEWRYATGLGFGRLAPPCCLPISLEQSKQQSQPEIMRFSTVNNHIQNCIHSA